MAAKIPRIQPGGTQLINPKVDTRSTSVEQTQTIGPGRGLEALGKDAQRTADFLYQKMDAARNYAENAKADNYRTEYMADQLFQESLNRNEDGSPITNTDTSDFEESAKKGKDKLKEIYTNKEELQKAQLNWDKEVLVSSNAVRTQRLKNLGIVGQVETGKLITREQANYASAPAGKDGDQARSLAMSKIDTKLKEGVGTGVYDELQAQKLRTSSLDKAKQDRFLFDLENNTGDVVDNLKSNKYNFDVKELKDANAVWKTEKSRIYNQNEINLDQLKFDGELDEAKVNQYVQDGKIEPASGSRYLADLRAIDASNPDSFEMVSFTERATEIARMGKRWNNWIRNPQEAAQRFAEATLLRGDVMDARAKKRLSKKEAQNILGDMKGAFSNYEPYVDGILKLKDFSDKNYSPKQRDTIKKQLYSSFMELVKNGEDPVKAINLSQATLYPQYNFDDLITTSKESGYTIQQVVDLLDKRVKK